MDWQLEQFLAERVERARKLLAESEEHRGSTDLQVCVGSGAGHRRGSAGVAASEPLDSIATISWPPYRFSPGYHALQRFVEQMDLTVALHRTFLRGDGQPRQGLSERERQQASKQQAATAAGAVVQLAAFPSAAMTKPLAAAGPDTVLSHCTAQAFIPGSPARG
jgi:hypothetical protein